MAAYSCVGSGAPTRISVWPVGRAACSLCGTGSVIGCAPVTPPAGGMIAAVFPVQKHGQTLRWQPPDGNARNVLRTSDSLGSGMRAILSQGLDRRREEASVGGGLAQRHLSLPRAREKLQPTGQPAAKRS